MPKVSIIIPSYDGYREGNVPKLKQDLYTQTFEDFELIIVEGVKPNGKARNVGAQKAKGEILVFIDDDTRLGSKELIENFVKILSENDDIGIVGASRFLPPDSNTFQKIAHNQLSRTYYPLVDKITDSDMATHDCMAIKKELYIKVGGEHEKLLRGTDPDLRYRVRSCGYRVVIAPNTYFYHPMPKNLAALIRKSFKNGMAAAWVFKNYPELTYEAPDSDSNVKEFPPKRSFIYRWTRRIFDLLFSILRLRFIRAISDFTYILGYIYGLIIKNERIEKLVY